MAQGWGATQMSCGSVYANKKVRVDDSKQMSVLTANKTNHVDDKEKIRVDSKREIRVEAKQKTRVVKLNH